MRSALLVAPGERAAETRESTPHPRVRTRLQKGQEAFKKKQKKKQHSKLRPFYPADMKKAALVKPGHVHTSD